MARRQLLAPKRRNGRHGKVVAYEQTAPMKSRSLRIQEARCPPLLEEAAPLGGKAAPAKAAAVPSMKRRRPSSGERKFGRRPHAARRTRPVLAEGMHLTLDEPGPHRRLSNSRGPVRR
jgi:hypothetical protein